MFDGLLGSPLGTFALGIVLGGCGMGGVAGFYWTRHRDLSRFLAALMEYPNLYERARRDQWLPLCEAQAAKREVTR